MIFKVTEVCTCVRECECAHMHMRVCTRAHIPPFLRETVRKERIKKLNSVHAKADNGDVNTTTAGGNGVGKRGRTNSTLSFRFQAERSCCCTHRSDDRVVATVEVETLPW